MPFFWGKPPLKNTKKHVKRDKVHNGSHSLLWPFVKEVHGAWLPANILSSGSTSRRIEVLPQKTTKSSKVKVSNPNSPSTLASQTPSFSDAQRGHPLPLPCLPSALDPNKSSDVLSGCLAHNGSLFPLPFPNKVKLRTEARDDDGAIPGNGSGSSSSINSLSSGDMPQLHSGHPDKAISDIKLALEFKMQDETCRSIPYVLQGENQNSTLSQDVSSPSFYPALEKSEFSCLSKRISCGVKGANYLELQNQVNASVNSSLNSLLSSPRLSPRRDYKSEQSFPSAPVAIRNSESVKGGTVQILGSKPCQYAPNWPIRETPGLNLGQQGKGSRECSPLPSPRVPTIRTGSSSVAHSSRASPIHPATSGLHLDSAVNFPEDRRAEGHPLPMPPALISTPSPYASPSMPSSPRSVQLHVSPRIENSTIPTSQWQKGKLLGCGTFGNVYKGFSDSGTFCAMKEVLISDDPRSKESVKQLGQEIQLLSQLRHPNIVQYWGSEIFEDRMYIYLEYVSGGSIHKLLQEYGQFKEPVIRSYTRQILCGLAYLHSMQTVHRDIKGANILVDTNGEVKLADFGMAKHINAYSIPLSFKGSPYWMAPEVFKNTNGYNYPVDIWSLGCTIIEMATAKPPWSQYEGIAALFKIGNSKEVPSIPETLSKEGQEFVQLCLQRYPLDRPSALELLEHPFARLALDGGEEMNSGLNHLMSTTTAICALDLEQRQDYGHDVGHVRSLQSAVSSGSSLLHPQLGPVSPMASPCNSPRVQSRALYHTYKSFSPSPISSPLVGSGSSTPRSGGYGSFPFIGMPGQAVMWSSPAENYRDVSRRPDKACASSPGNYVGFDIESKDDPYEGIQSAYTSRTRMYRYA